MKKLYCFTETQEKLIDEEVITKDESGNDVKTIKKVKKPTTRNFFIRNPTRALNDEASLYYASKVSEYIKRGLVTLVQLEKRYQNDGGVYTDDEKKEREKAYHELLKKQEELQKLALISDIDKTQEQKQQHENLLNEISKLTTILRDFETFRAGLYDCTAEFKARNALLTWWTLYLSYEEVSEKLIPIFGDGSFEDKLVKYDELLESDDEFIKKIINKLMYFVGFWAINNIKTEKEFKEVEKLIPNDEGSEKST